MQLPLPATLKREYGTYSVTYTKDKNIITAERKLVTEHSRYPQGAPRRIRAFHRVVDSDQLQQIALETELQSGPKLPEELKMDDLVAAGRRHCKTRTTRPRWSPSSAPRN